MGFCNASNLASYIDHTLLKPEASEECFVRLCEEAVRYGFYSVCVNGFNVSFCRQQLNQLPGGDRVRVCSVVGFPLGATSSVVKCFEAEKAIADGAIELDMVINVAQLKCGKRHYVEQEILDVARIAHAHQACLKVIIETCLLTDDEKREACCLAKFAEADFVKTSTGFSSKGATVADLELMRQVVGLQMGVKIAGGVRGDNVQALFTAARGNLQIDPGPLLVRIGSSGSVQLLKDINRL